MSVIEEAVGDSGFDLVNDEERMRTGVYISAPNSSLSTLPYRMMSIADEKREQINEDDMCRLHHSWLAHDVANLIGSRG